MFRAQVNQQHREILLPWRAINNALAVKGAPGVDVKSFGMRFDSEGETGILHNILQGHNGSFNEDGIKLLPDDKSDN